MRFGLSVVLRGSALALVSSLIGFSSAQDALTLEDALRLAKQNNGTVRSAALNVAVSGARLRQAFAAYYPTITPSYQYNSNRQEFTSATGTQSVTTEGSTTQATASWRLLDSGQRAYTVAASRQTLASQRYSSRQTLRQTLFSVVQQYYEALRAQELQRVSDAQVSRANTILEQTDARVQVKDAAAKDVLQAQADMLNARVEALQARNQTATTSATLKATVGLESEKPLPKLVPLSSPPAYGTPDTLASLIEEGVKNRPDLLSRRRSIESQRYGLLRQNRDASVSFTLDANLTQQFTPDSLQNRSWSLMLSYPLFDGDLLRQQARETRLSIEANQADLLQAEREARAEIETAYFEYTQNHERLEAAQSATAAAKTNYEAALEAQKLGAGDVIAVLTAQVSLVTAESNYIQAVYDYTISNSKLSLVTGRPVPGE